MNINKQNLDTTYLCATGGIGGAGKDFTISSITSFFSEIASIDKNATTLKEIVNVAIYNLYNDYISDSFPGKSEVTSKQFNVPIFSEDVFEDIKNNNDFKLPFEKNYSVREVLQLLGTDVIRDISTDFHVKMLARRILNNPSQFVFITDARFSNEYNFVKTFNAMASVDDKINFLNDISVFEEDELPSRSDMKDKIQLLFGDNEFSLQIMNLLAECFYNDEYLVKSYNSSQESANSLLQHDHVYSHDFASELKQGALFVLRESSRDLPTHSSEKHNIDIITSIPGNPEDAVFNNDITPITENEQFKSVIEFLIIKASSNYFLSNDLELSDDMVINDHMPTNIISLIKIISKAKSVPQPLIDILEMFQNQYPEKLIKQKNKKDEKIQSK